MSAVEMNVTPTPPERPVAAIYDRVITELVAVYERERSTRMRLLRRHAVMAVGVGVLMTVGGAPQTIETLLGEWVRPLLGSLAVVAGVLLAVGLRRHRDRLTLETVALGVLGLWDLLMLATFTVGLAVYGLKHGLVLVAPWSTAAIPVGQPAVYPLPIYAGLVSMVWGVHLRAIRDEQRDLTRLADLHIPQTDATSGPAGSR